MEKAPYPHNFSGIVQSYINGLPFLSGTIIGDVGYTVALFGAYELVRMFVAYRKKKLVTAD